MIQVGKAPQKCFGEALGEAEAVPLIPVLALAVIQTCL